MAKLSRRKRAELREKEERRKAALEKMGEPYSRHKLRTCHHFVGHIGGFLPGNAVSILVKISDTECMCEKCRATFPLEFMEEMERLIRGDEMPLIVGEVDPEKKLLSVCRTKRYYYSGPDEICYIDEP